MIGSLMSRLGDAEKLSVGQLQQAIQDGIVPAYVGVPLLQDKIAQVKKAQMIQQGAMQQQAPIAQQVLAEAQGIEMAQSNLPTQGYAPGGIIGYGADDANDGYAGGGMVAFSGEDGSLVDEEDDDSSEDYGMSKEEQRIFASLLSQYQTPMNEDEAAGIAGINPEAASGIGIRSDAKAPRGIESLEARVLRQESGGRDFDKNGNPLTSSAGAKYAMQVMPATARDPGFGITPARNDSPEEYNRVGRELLGKLYQKYNGDEQLTLAAYNWGSGNVDKYLKAGRDISMVPKETRQYASMAQGGIAHFDGKDSSLVKDIYGLGEAFYSPSKWWEGAKNLAGIGDTNLLSKIIPGAENLNPFTLAQKGKEAKAARDLKVTSPYSDSEKDFPLSVEEGQAQIDAYNAEIKKAADDKAAADAAAAAKAEEEKKAAAELTKEDSDIADYRQWLKSYGEDIKKQKETDKYMALLAAGLGMMGGTSPHALTNVGQGGMKGVEALLAAKKATGADERALMAGQLGLSKATLYDKMRRDALAQKALSDKALAEYRQKQIDLGSAKIKAAENAAYLKARKQFMDEGGEQKIQAKYTKKYGKDFMSDPVALRNYQLEINAGINELARINSADEIPLSSER